MLPCATPWSGQRSNVNGNQSSSNWPMTRDTPSWSALKTTILPSWPTVTISGLLHTRPVQGALSHGKWCARAQCWETDKVCGNSYKYINYASCLSNIHAMSKGLVTCVCRTPTWPVCVPDCCFGGADKWSQRRLTMRWQFSLGPKTAGKQIHYTTTTTTKVQWQVIT